MSDPVIESIKKQRRDEVETLAREKFDAFHHDIAPHKKKAIETLNAFEPLRVEGRNWPVKPPRFKTRRNK